MKDAQRQAVQSYLRVHDFVTAHPLTAPATYGPATAMLEQAIAQLGEHRGNQETGTRLTRANTRMQAELRVQVQEQLKPMVKIARVALRRIPAADRALTMPATKSTVGLIDSAKAFREIGASYAQVFVEHGLAADFLAALDSSVAELVQSLSATGQSVGRHVGARAALAQSIRLGRDALVLLDAVVQTQFAGNDGVLAEWTNAKRIKFSTRSATSGPTTGGSQPAAGSPTVSASVTAVPATPTQAAA